MVFQVYLGDHPATPRVQNFRTNSECSRKGYRNLPQLPASIWIQEKMPLLCCPVGHGKVSVNTRNKGIHMTAITQGQEDTAEGKHAREGGKEKLTAEHFLMTHELPSVAPSKGNHNKAQDTKSRGSEVLKPHISVY